MSELTRHLILYSGINENMIHKLMEHWSYNFPSPLWEGVGGGGGGGATSFARLLENLN